MGTSIWPGGPSGPGEEFGFYSKGGDKSLRILSQEHNPCPGSWGWACGVGT